MGILFVQKTQKCSGKVFVIMKKHLSHNPMHQKDWAAD